MLRNPLLRPQFFSLPFVVFVEPEHCIFYPLFGRVNVPLTHENAGMPRHLLNCERVCSSFPKAGQKRMAKVVEAEFGEFQPFHYPLVLALDGVVGDRFSAIIAEDVPDMRFLGFLVSISSSPFTLAVIGKFRRALAVLPWGLCK